MPGNKYNGNSSNIPTSRLERLLRDRELRKSGRASENNGEAIEEEVVRLREEESAAEAATKGAGGGEERQETKPFRQRLLVVANRLPVSAVRKGEDAWSLEMSAGGLVSALLGKWRSSWSWCASFFC